MVVVDVEVEVVVGMVGMVGAEDHLMFKERRAG